ncbi:MAG: hypothetical protein NUW02_02420 [Candidatus Campbellbacteria bacterium]|nr:hypothetical protein [Candidatus Campbellbacteria bacterium]
MSRIPFISKTWREGRVWDLWMVVHLFSGVTIGFANSFLGLSTPVLFFVTLTGMIIWEIVEIFNGVHEMDENRILDILLGLIGLFGAVQFSRYFLEPQQHIAFYISALILTFGCYLGWRAYQKRVADL